jgi:hypothetical protein
LEPIFLRAEDISSFVGGVIRCSLIPNPQRFTSGATVISKAFSELSYTFNASFTTSINSVETSTMVVSQTFDD